MKSPNCGVKLFLCECRGPRLERSSAVQREEGRLAGKSVTARPPSFHNARQWVPRNIWTKVASLAIYGEGDVLFCFFPQRAWQCPPCCLGRQGLPMAAEKHQSSKQSSSGSWLQKLCLGYVTAAPLARHWFALTVTQSTLYLGLCMYPLRTQTFQLDFLSLLTTNVPT